MHMSPEVAKRILSSVDGLLNFASEDSGLPIRTQVRGEFIDRKGVKKKVEASLEKADANARLQSASLVLKKMGLVPRDFDLRAFVLGIRNDPLAGFYDPDTKVFYMLNWVPEEQQLPVMAHELTHALQDQYVGLESWLKEPDESEKSASEEKGIDEPSLARHAATEGQATAVMLDYLLAPRGHQLVDLPPINQATLQDLMRRNTRPAVLRAPRYLRESQAFPYSYGLEFIHEIWKKGGKARAFAGVLKNPPRNSHQIMHPAAYLAGEKILPLVVPPLASILGSEFERIDSGVVGEFDVMEFAQQFSSDQKARLISDGWRGGYYYLARRKTQPAEAKLHPAANPVSTEAAPPVPKAGVGDDLMDVSLFYLSRWATSAGASRFAQLYASSVPARYNGATEKPSPKKANEPGETIRVWDTQDGTVSIEARGHLVLVLESFDPAIAARLRRAWQKGTN